MRLYLPSLVAFAAELGTGIRHAVHPHAERPEPPRVTGTWLLRQP